MILKEILYELKEFGLYTREEWDEYMSYFSNSSELREYIRFREDSPVKEAPVRELEQRIRSGKGVHQEKPLMQKSAKVLDKESLAEIKAREGIVFGVVSGCFDLLHLGHIRSMAYAKQYLEQYPCSALCVLVLSDENIRIKKGESRPVLSINERLEMISNIVCVDYVIPLQEPNCLAVLEALKPQYFFKGNADRSQNIVRQEMELVESNKGSVIIFPKGQGRGRSTTQLIDEVLEKLLREW